MPIDTTMANIPISSVGCNNSLVSNCKPSIVLSESMDIATNPTPTIRDKKVKHKDSIRN